MNRIIIKDKKSNYFFKDIYKEYNVYEMYGLRTDKKLHKILARKGIFIFGKWRKVVKQCDEIIIFESLYNLRVAKHIKKYNPNCRVILFFWNTIVDKTRKKYLEDDNIDEFWTFDPKDAVKYNLNLNTQFYTKKIKLKEDIRPEIDVLFLGRDKGRKDKLLELERNLQHNNINTRINIIEKSKDYVSYQKYLKDVEKSKVILEYVIEGQTGLTLRCMESLFFKKKLITNNREIEKYEFYNPNNIFVLGKDNLDDIKQFIDSEYIEIDPKIIEYYDIEKWLNRFNKKEGKI